MRIRVLLICIGLFISIKAHSQDNADLTFSSNNLSLQGLLLAVEDQSDYYFVYNPSQIPLDKTIDFDRSNYTIQELLNFLTRRYELEFELDVSLSRIIISLSSIRSLSGIVVDSLSSESLIGALIMDSEKYLGSSNHSGYFNVFVDADVEFIDIYNVAYETKRYYLTDDREEEVMISMKPRINVKVIITDEDNLHNFDYSEIPLDVIQDHYGTSGVNDLVQTIKFGAGVSAGSEAQNGYTVRGGGPHQNLILIDGIPIYEASHLGGLSSIFLTSSIKSIDFHKSSFSSRYGGRASSVLDVRLKDGNRNEFSREFSAGLEGLNFHIDGPLSESTSFNLNARMSWFSRLAEPVVKRYTDVNDLALRYNDSYAKLSHWFSPTSILSFSAYIGDDLVKIQRDQLPEAGSGFQDLNRISWGNKFLSLQWNKLISDKMFMSINLGRSSYNYRSRGSYQLNYFENDSIKTTAFDILSISNIVDNVLDLEFDYYPENLGRIKFGIHAANNNNNPSITESEIFAADDEEPMTIDTTYNFQELAVFLENEYSFSDGIVLNTGIRLNNYFTANKSYSYLEPRLNLKFLWEKNIVSMSYSRMSQFIHLLSNPAPGLPSDLWVPSTDIVKPEVSNIMSLDYSYLTKGLSFNVSAWYKTFDNLIEYANTSEVLYSLIIDNELYQVEVDNIVWEDRVTIGKGRAYGLEFSLHKKLNNWDFKVNYSHSRSFREFSVIDGGDEFPYKYDTPHSAGVLIKYKIDENSSLSTNWQYASGTAYSLADSERLGPDGESILIYSSRNNFRLPSFHHLDIHYQRQKELKSGVLSYSVGVYNVYNRLNAFYEYLSQESNSEAPDIVKISLYPILPQFNLSYSW